MCRLAPNNRAVSDATRELIRPNAGKPSGHFIGQRERTRGTHANDSDPLFGRKEPPGILQGLFSPKGKQPPTRFFRAGRSSRYFSSRKNSFAKNTRGHRNKHPKSLRKTTKPRLLRGVQPTPHNRAGGVKHTHNSFFCRASLKAPRRKIIGFLQEALSPPNVGERKKPSAPPIVRLTLWEHSSVR